MRSRLAQVAISCFLVGLAIHAQDSAPTASDTSTSKPCPALSPAEEKASVPQTQIAEVMFSGTLELPESEQGKIAETIKQRVSGGSRELITDMALELAREGWQNYGYFKVDANGEARTLTSNAVSQRVAISIQVDEGPQYRLGEITFKGSKAFSNALLRGFFPIQGGEIFSREKVAQGLDNLREAYGELGYVNFISIPAPILDDPSGIVSFEIDIDEGKQFRIATVKVAGVGESEKQEILETFPTGEVYNIQTLREFSKKHPEFRIDDPFRMEMHYDQRSGTVSINFDARPCAAN